MRLKKNSKSLIVLASLGLLAGSIIYLAKNTLETAFHKASEEAQRAREEEHHQNNVMLRELIAQNLAPLIKKNQFQSQVEMNWQGKKKPVQLTYTLDSILQEEASHILNSYKPDYGAIVVMDPSTGKILAMTSFQRDDRDAENLALRATFPAASVFKMVTATVAIDKYRVQPDTVIPFNGGNHTLYKHNVFDNRVTRWTHEVTLREAFARSLNTVFGKLGIKYMQPQDLIEYANRFHFNRQIAADFPVETGKVTVPNERSFELAEVTSGYNKINKMSPVQGAMMAASVVEDGVMRAPYVVSEIRDSSGSVMYQASPEIAAITMSPLTAQKLRVLMGETVAKGTSRKSFRKFVRNKKFREVEVGGKTGSLHGDDPKGKVDWFVGYAKDGSDRLAIGAITVNRERWTIKASQIAELLFKKHFAD